MIFMSLSVWICQLCFRTLGDKDIWRGNLGEDKVSLIIDANLFIKYT